MVAAPEQQIEGLVMENNAVAPKDEIVLSTSYRLNSWMKDLHESIKHLKIGQLSLASAHNAGMDKKALYSNSYITCQDDTFRHQLDNGVRVLDIRLRWYAGYGAGNVNEGLRFIHSQSSSRTFANMHQAVDRFQEENPGEIIIMDFHDFDEQNKDKPVPYALIHEHFTRHHIKNMLPRSAASLTLEQIKIQYPGPRFIVAVPHEVCANGRDKTYFWDKIDHQWAGGGVVSSPRLFSFIDSVMASPPTSDKPWSLSATTYGVLGPGNIVGQLCDRFPVGGDWQRKSSIINFDWCTRSSAAMIRQCIESNVFKVNRLAITSPLQGETYFNGASSVKGIGIPGATVELYDTGAGWYDAGVVNAQGAWEARVNLYPVSHHPLKCRQKINGVESDWSNTVTFNVVSHIPTPTITTPANGISVRSVRPLISGENGVPGATVRFYEAGSGADLYGTAVVGPDGKWASEPDLALPARAFALTCDQFGRGWQSPYALASTFTVATPNPPMNLSVKLESSGGKTIGARVSWERNPADAGKKTSFVYYLNDVFETVTSLEVVKFDNLSRNAYYVVTVFTVDESGVHSDSAKYAFATPEYFIS